MQAVELGLDLPDGIAQGLDAVLEPFKALGRIPRALPLPVPMLLAHSVAMLLAHAVPLLFAHAVPMLLAHAVPMLLAHAVAMRPAVSLRPVENRAPEPMDIPAEVFGPAGVVEAVLQEMGGEHQDFGLLARIGGVFAEFAGLTVAAALQEGFPHMDALFSHFRKIPLFRLPQRRQRHLQRLDLVHHGFALLAEAAFGASAATGARTAFAKVAAIAAIAPFESPPVGPAAAHVFVQAFQFSPHVIRDPGQGVKFFLGPQAFEGLHALLEAVQDPGEMLDFLRLFVPPAAVPVFPGFLGRCRRCEQEEQAEKEAMADGTGGDPRKKGASGLHDDFNLPPIRGVHPEARIASQDPGQRG